MDQQTFTNISKILASDAKATTYKFALLRGTIDLITDNSPFITIVDKRANFPLGLLIKKWLLYYFPLTDIPQIRGKTDLAFNRHLKLLTDYYKSRGGISVFHNDLTSLGIPNEISHTFLAVAKQLAKTITGMPMRYIGNSLNQEEYSIFNYQPSSFVSKIAMQLDTEYLIERFGTFSIPLEYYKAFQVLGSFISGQDAILFKWAEFSAQASGKNFSINAVLNEILKSPVTERQIFNAKRFYEELHRKDGKMRCVWSGKSIVSYNIDHVIPFAVWKNNDLWNLLPADASVNKTKSDKIPTPKLIENQRELIVDYWNILNNHFGQPFRKEIQTALLGYNKYTNWQDQAIEQLKLTCHTLITIRGFDSWDYSMGNR